MPRWPCDIYVCTYNISISHETLVFFVFFCRRRSSMPIESLAEARLTEEQTISFVYPLLFKIIVCFVKMRARLQWYVRLKIIASSIRKIALFI